MQEALEDAPMQQLNGAHLMHCNGWESMRTLWLRKGHMSCSTEGQIGLLASFVIKGRLGKAPRITPRETDQALRCSHGAYWANLFQTCVEHAFTKTYYRTNCFIGVKMLSMLFALNISRQMPEFQRRKY